MTAANLFLRLFALVLALSAAKGHAQAPAAVPDDRATSVGRWDIVSVEYNGKPIDPELVARLQVAFRTDGSWAVFFKRLPVAEGKSTNRESDSPKTFELETLGSENVKPVRYTGIYKAEGDFRVLCFALDSEPRPDAFAAPRRSGRTLVTLKRAREP